MTDEKSFHILVINGPNINLLGNREVEHYGTESLQSINDKLKALATKLSIDLEIYQSNYEGDIIERIHKGGKCIDGIVINPAAFTNSSYAILEAIIAFEIPFIEVHLSNIYAREPWHAQSIFSAKAVGSIVGLKGYGYELGVQGILDYLINLNS